MKRVVTLIELLLLLALSSGCADFPDKVPATGCGPETENEKIRADRLVLKLASEIYKERQKADLELRILLLESESLDSTVAYLKSVMEKTEDIDLKIRLNNITSSYYGYFISGSILRKHLEWVPFLTSNDDGVRYRFIEQLALSEHPAPKAVFIAALEDKYLYTREKALEAIVRKMDKNDKDLLMKVMKEADDDYIREKAAYYLRFYSGSEVVNALIEFMKDTSFYAPMSYTAACSLGKMGDEEAVKPLIKTLQDSDGTTRFNAASALGFIGDRRAVGPLIELLKHDVGASVRSRSAYCLGEIGDERAVEPLIDALKDKDFEVRKSAIKSLGGMNAKEAVPSLIEALKDKYEEARLATAKALKKITGEDFGTDYEKWKAWYEKNKDK